MRAIQEELTVALVRVTKTGASPLLATQLCCVMRQYQSHFALTEPLVPQDYQCTSLNTGWLVMSLNVSNSLPESIVT
jgi:hypothetical protein